MFRPMRRFKQALSPEECRAVLERGTSGVLALSGDGGWPYAVPLSYVYADGKIYFHSAKSGHKVDAIRSCPRASFCVIDQDHIVPEEYTTYFRSVIAFGNRPDFGGGEGEARRHREAGGEVRPPPTAGRTGTGPSTGSGRPCACWRWKSGASVRQGGHRTGAAAGELTQPLKRRR